MKLERLKDRIWVYPYEEERDRPNLTYIRGDRWSLAVDAGHSAEHTREFYRSLEAEGLPLPQLTVITHWHWDHTLGMHAVHGLTLANEITNRHLAALDKQLREEGTEVLFSWHESIRREYANGQPVVVTLADMTFTGEMHLDAGNCPIHIFQADSPHTDDSTLVYLPNDKLLILGDSTGGRFPDWYFDQVSGDNLAETIQKVNPELCLPGHWTVLPTKGVVQELLDGEG